MTMSTSNQPVVLVYFTRSRETAKDAWGHEVKVSTVRDAVVLERTDETVERNDGYDIRQDEVWACKWTGRKFAKSIDCVGGMGYWFRRLKDTGDGLVPGGVSKVFQWEEIGSHGYRFVLNGVPCTAEAAEAALRAGDIGLRSAGHGHDLTITPTEKGGIRLVCATCGTEETFETGVPFSVVNGAAAGHSPASAEQAGTDQ